MSYGWIIDRDHLAEQYHDASKAGTVGPQYIPDWMRAVLENHDGNASVPSSLAYGEGAGHSLRNAEIFAFNLYDDDGELYYSGRMITDEGASELACYGPLHDFGAPNAGCTGIRYPGHSEMDI